MEFANGNYALLGSALQYAQDTTAPSVTASGNGVANVDAGREVHVRRGGVDLLHARRLDADDGLDGVEAEPPA